MLLVTYAVGLNRHRVGYSPHAVVAVAAIADMCWVACIEATKGISRALRTHGFGATYLDGYGEGLEGNEDGEAD